jgi:putative alpha-1,2-mannosidase
VELGSTRKAGLYRYTFPNASSPNVVVDVSHVLPSYRGQGLGQNYLGGRIDIKEEQPGDFHYEGYGIYDNVSREFLCL